jgi:hydrogenase expression/formation protein HypC
MCLAVPGRVVSVTERHGTTMADVDFGGVRKEVCLAYIPDVEVGEYVIVHVGFAIQRLDEQSAQETLASFAQLGILEEEFGDGFEIAARQAGVEQ